MAADLKPIRRVVTGTDERGRSKVVWDGPAPNAHAASMGAWSKKFASIAELEAGLKEAAGIDRTTVLVIDTDPLISTDAGGHWWDVAVPEVSARPQVNAARKEDEDALKGQKL